MCCASRFCKGGRVADPSECPSMKQNASTGEQAEPPRRRWKPKQEQHPGPENQDSQHMLNQARGLSLISLHTHVQNWPLISNSVAHPFVMFEKQPKSA